LWIFGTSFLGAKISADAHLRDQCDLHNMRLEWITSIPKRWRCSPCWRTGFNAICSGKRDAKHGCSKPKLTAWRATTGHHKSFSGDKSCRPTVSQR
jgi:hypothetical protein